MQCIRAHYSKNNNNNNNKKKKKKKKKKMNITVYMYWVLT